MFAYISKYIKTLHKQTNKQTNKQNRTKQTKTRFMQTKRDLPHESLSCFRFLVRRICQKWFFFFLVFLALGLRRGPHNSCVQKQEALCNVSRREVCHVICARRPPRQTSPRLVSNPPAGVETRVPQRLGHFRFNVGHFFKTRPSAQAFVWKRV